MQNTKLREEFSIGTHDTDENANHQALLEMLSTEPPRTINVIEMIAKSGGHICSGIQGPSPEMINRVVDLSDF